MTPPLTIGDVPGGEAGGGPGGGEPVAAVAAARINKLPAFWPDDPVVWFAQVEALFELNGITVDKTKFSYILAHSSEKLFPYITSIVKEEFTEGESRYEKFKSRVIQGFSTSEEAKLRKLFKGHNLGDKTPSQFLVLLRNNAPNQCNDKILKSLFLENLPESIRTILAVMDSEDLDKLALAANKIMENQASPMMLNQVKLPQENSQFTQLQESVNQRTKQLQKLTSAVFNRSRSQSKGKNGNKNLNNNSPVNNNNNQDETKLCWAHNRFGAAAYSCKPPCSYKTTNPSSEN